MNVSASLKGNERLQAKDEELIPGIPDEITLDHITPKLPWRAFHVLSSVCHGWLNVIRNHQVYKARVRSNGTETLALVLFSNRHRMRSIALYSMRDKSWVELPQIPEEIMEDDIPWFCQCVSLDGKVYVLGGGTEILDGPSENAVYMLDVAGQREWKPCASMRGYRTRFASGVMNGKIYAFGGVSSRGVCGSEVYDPKEDLWSPIRRMSTLRISYRAEIVGEEFFLHDGLLFDRESFQSAESSGLDPYNENEAHPVKVISLDVYHPGNDTFRTLNPFGVGSQEDHKRVGFTSHHVFFGAGGGFYVIDQFHIHVLDGVNENSWACVHSFSFCEAIERPGMSCIVPLAVRAVDDELLVIVCIRDCCPRTDCFVLQSRGFKSKTEEIAWQKVPIPPFFADGPLWYDGWYNCDGIHSIQL